MCFYCVFSISCIMFHCCYFRVIYAIVHVIHATHSHKLFHNITSRPLPHHYSHSKLPSPPHHTTASTISTQSHHAPLPHTTFHPQFEYQMDNIQMTFLQLSSSHAHQNLTYHCRNSAVYYDKQSMKYDNAAKFKSYNDIELVALRPTKFRYSVSLDECQVRGRCGCCWWWLLVAIVGGGGCWWLLLVVVVVGGGCWWW